MTLIFAAILALCALAFLAAVLCDVADPETSERLSRVDDELRAKEGRP